ncbi:MAG: biotin/lipoyl-binding protein [Dehalococcoidia bacterium]|nr:biotin/lipoyl-binding protein [Dehalococcoidia bacterium]
MMDDLDDLSPEGGARWRKRLIAGGVVVAVVAAGAYALWTTTLKGSASMQLKTQTQAVTRGTIRQTVSTTGTVSARSSTNLSFQQSGRVTAVNVKPGDAVTQGEVLAQVDTSDLQTALKTAQANLASAGIKLHQLQQGALASDLAAADQSVVQAQSANDKAQNDLAALNNPPAAADDAAARAAVTAAQSQLSQAQAALATLLAGPSASDLASAQAVVTSAQTALTAAQNSAQNAQNALGSAQASLFASETGYCSSDQTPQFCAVRSAPLSEADRALLLGVTQTPAAQPTGTPQAGAGQQSAATLAAAVLGSNSSYLAAANSAANAGGSVTSAQAALTSAQAKLAAVQAPPTASAVAAAQAAVSVAQDNLDAANAKLATLEGGPTQAALQAAQDAVASAGAGLQAAQAKRDLVAQGSTADDIRLQQTAVQLAQLSVDSAQANIKKAQIIAPYNGTVAAVNVRVGDMASGGAGSASSASSSSASSAAPIVVNTPDAVQIDLTIGEADIAQVKVGERGVATFSALPGGAYPFTIDSISGVPTVSQGVVTYAAQATLLTGAAASTPGAGLSAPGGGGFGQSTQPDAGATPTGKPMPGMSASAIIQVQQATNVLMVPATAIKRQAGNAVLDVSQADGSTKTVVVRTGLSDGTNIEVLEGVSEGDKVVLPSLAVGGRTTNVSTTTGAAPGGHAGGGGEGGIAPPSNGVPGGVR